MRVIVYIISRGEVVHTTISFPLFSGFLASLIAATVAAPDEIPTYMEKMRFICHKNDVAAISAYAMICHKNTVAAISSYVLSSETIQENMYPTCVSNFSEFRTSI